MAHGSGPWGICDVCGFRHRLSEMRRRWDQLIVCDADFEERHPQEFVRTVRDKIVVYNARPPEPEPPPVRTGSALALAACPRVARALAAGAVGLVAGPVVPFVASEYDADAYALFARFTTPADTDRKAHINTLIVALKAAGVWTKCDALWVMAAHDAQAAQRNWKADANNLTPVAAPTFTTDRGYQGDGAASYLNTNFNPASHAFRFTTSSCHMGVWSRSNADSIAWDMSAQNASVADRAGFRSRFSNVFMHLLGVEESGDDFANTDSSGHLIANRSGATATQAYRSGSSLGSGSASNSSFALPNRNVYIGAGNNGGSAEGFSSREYSAAHIGGSLTSAEVLAFHAALDDYMAAVGAGSSGGEAVGIAAAPTVARPAAGRASGLAVGPLVGSLSAGLGAGIHTSPTTGRPQGAIATGLATTPTVGRAHAAIARGLATAPTVGVARGGRATGVAAAPTVGRAYGGRATGIKASPTVDDPTATSGAGLGTMSNALVIQNGQVTADLTNFPVLLNQTNLPSAMMDADGANPAQSNGGDIRFSTDSGGNTQIPCEIVRFTRNNNPALAEVQIWVKVPSVANSTDTTIYVWWTPGGSLSQPAVTDTYGRNAVWSDYIFVFHGESLTVDSTGGGKSLVTQSTPSSAGSTTQTKTGRSFLWGGAADLGYANIAAHASINNISPVTWQMWIHSQDDSFPLIQKTDDRAMLALESPFRYQFNGGGRLCNTPTVSDNAWSLIHWTWTGSTSSGQSIAYANGVAGSDAGAGPGSPNDSGTALSVGAEENVSYWNEFRWRGSVLSAAWIATEYNMMNSPSTFVIPA